MKQSMKDFIKVLESENYFAVSLGLLKEFDEDELLHIDLEKIEVILNHVKKEFGWAKAGLHMWTTTIN